MLEVSCRAFDLILRIAGDLGIDAAELFDGTGIDAAIARDPEKRVDWEPYLQVVERVCERAGGLSAIEAAGAALTDVPVSAARLAGFFASPLQFYRLAASWSSKNLFTILETEVVALSAVSLEVRIRVPEPHRLTHAFAHLTAGTFRVVPRFLGHSDATVQTSCDAKGCVYTIHHVPSQTLWARGARVLRAVFGLGSMFDELNAQNTALSAQVRELSAAREAAERAAALESRLFTTMTHELRTPLAGVISLAQLLESEPSAPDARETLGQILSSAQGLLSMVNDAVDLRHGRPEQPAVYGTVALGELLAVVHARFDRDAQHRGLDFTVELDPLVPAHVNSDRSALELVLLRLVDNALRFTERGRVVLRCYLHGEQLCFSVLDTGPGIPKAIQSRIFEPFVQAAEGLSRSHAGLGIGLSVAKNAAQTLGGSISMESTVGQGSRFVFSLPYVAETKAMSVPPKAAIASTAQPSPAPAADAVQSSGTCVALVVEDNLVNQKVVVRMINQLGATAETAENGQIAVERFGSRHYDVIFMDLQMPVMDGFQASAEIRRREKAGAQGRVPIIAVTANFEEEFRQRAASVGIDQFLGKPVSKAILSEALTRAGVEGWAAKAG